MIMSQFKYGKYKFIFGLVLIMIAVVIIKNIDYENSVPQVFKKHVNKQPRVHSNLTPLEEKMLNKKSKFEFSLLSDSALKYCYDKYLKNQYISNAKKVVFYPKPDSLTYSKVFVDEIEQVKKMPEINQAYTFIQTDMNSSISAIIVKENDTGKAQVMPDAENSKALIMTQHEFDEIKKFRDKCTIFCVINLKTGRIFSYSAVGQNEATNLSQTLTLLQNM